jgi:hypothetical protein
MIARCLGAGTLRPQMLIKRLALSTRSSHHDYILKLLRASNIVSNVFWAGRCWS